MRNLTPTSITQAFADYAKNAPSERTRTLLVSLAGHLHSFVRDNKVTQAEWGAAIDALTRATKFTDDKRNEYILFSDLLGVSSLVDMINAATTGTQSSVLGPFLIEGAPELPNGGDLWRGQVGEPLVVSGSVKDEKGAPAKGTVLALWQNSGNGLYAQQDAQQSSTNYHARLKVADDGVPVVAAFTMSTSDETPSRSENRMYSLRLSSVNSLALVSASMAAFHSAWVTLFSRTKPCRWPARLTSSVRVRADGAFLAYSAKASVMLVGVRLRMRGLPAAP